MATQQAPAVIVIFGEDEFAKSRRLHAAIEALLPPPADPALALLTIELDRRVGEVPDFSIVRDELATLPFLAPRRVVVIRNADRFISAHRERLEVYFQGPSSSGTLILECRSFPKNWRLYKAATAVGAVHECPALRPADAAGFVQNEARRVGKRIDPAAVAALVDRIGPSAGLLAAEIEKLALYVEPRQTISAEDVTALIGRSREESVFATAEAASRGDVGAALRLWQETLALDKSAEFAAVGGLAYLVRQWLTAARMLREGLRVEAIAPKVRMYGRARELGELLNRLPPARLRRLLAALAELDAKAKSGQRSIESGVEAWLIDAAQYRA